MRISRSQQFSVIFAFIMITWGMLPFFGYGVLDTMAIASSTILVLIGIAYPLALFKPQWNKVLLLLEGVVFALVGLIFLQPFYNIFFMLFGLLLVILAILAYVSKLPKGLLKFFYKAPK